MIARDFASAVRGIDRGFVARQRARGTPEAAIARMGGWCLADVQAVPRAPLMFAVPQAEPTLAAPLEALTIPDVAEILQHIAEQYDVTPEDILGPSHSPECVRPRHEAFAVVYELNRYTLAELSGIFRKTDRAILYGIKTHYERLSRCRPAAGVAAG